MISTNIGQTQAHEDICTCMRFVIDEISHEVGRVKWQLHAVVVRAHLSEEMARVLQIFVDVLLSEQFAH